LPALLLAFVCLAAAPSGQPSAELAGKAVNRWATAPRIEPSVLDTPANTGVERLARLGDTSYVESLALSGGVLYAGFGRRLVATDDLGGGLMSVTGSVELGGNIHSLAVDGSWLYARTDATVEVVHLPDLVRLAPVAAKQSPSADWACDLVRAGDWLFSCHYTGVQIFDLARPDQPRLARELPYSRTIALAVAGSLAVLLQSEGITVLDVKDPTNPKELATLSYAMNGAQNCAEGFNFNSVALAARLALVACTSAGGLGYLFTIDLTEPRAPRWLGRTRLAFSNSLRYRIRLHGTFAYVVGNAGGLMRVDLANPGILPPATWWPTLDETIVDVVADDHTVYLAGSRGVRTVEDPDQSGSAGSRARGNFPLDLSGRPLMSLDGARGLVVDQQQRSLVVLDLTDPAAPRKMGSLERQSESFATLTTRGSKAYATTSQNRFLVIDISNPTAPAVRGETNVREVVDLAAMDGFVLAASRTGVVVLDLSNPSGPKTVATVPAVSQRDYPTRLALAGSRAYVLSSLQRLTVLDLADPARPQILGTLDGVGDPDGSGEAGLAVAGQHLLVASAAGVSVVDVRDPAQPWVAGWWSLPWEEVGAVGIEVLGHYAMVSNRSWSNGGVAVLDIADALAPVFLSTWHGWPKAVAVDGAAGKALVAWTEDDGGMAPAWLTTIDIGHPQPMVLRQGIAAAGGAGGVAVQGGYAYRTSWSQGLHVLDVQDPRQPRRVGGLELPAASWQIALDGARAYLLGDIRVAGRAQHSASVLLTVDITDPSQPRLVNSYSLGTPYHYAFAVRAGLAYVAEWPDDAKPAQLLTLDVAGESGPQLLTRLDLPKLDAAILMAVSGQLAVLMDYGGTFQLVNLTDPRAPAAGPDLALGGRPKSLVLDGGLGFVLSLDNGDIMAPQIMAVDLTDPARPRVLGRTDLSGMQSGTMAADDGTLWVTVNRGVLLFSMEPSGGLRAVTRYEGPDYHLPDYWWTVDDIAVEGKLAYLSTDDSLLWILRYGEIQSPADCCLYLPRLEQP
jgi:hypothetical protein